MGHRASLPVADKQEKGAAASVEAPVVSDAASATVSAPSPEAAEASGDVSPRTAAACRWRAKRTSLVNGAARRASAAANDYEDDFEADDGDDDYADEDFEVFEGDDDGGGVSRPFACATSDGASAPEFRRRASLDNRKYKSRWNKARALKGAAAALVDVADDAADARDRAAAIKAGKAPKAVAFRDHVQVRLFERADDKLAFLLYYTEDDIDAMYRDTCAETQRGDPIGGYDTEDRPEEADSTDDADDDGSDSDDSDAPPRIAGADAGGAGRPEPAPPHKAADSFRGAGSPTISTRT